MAIVVPKMDERLGLERSWGIDLGRAHGQLESGKRFWGVRGGDLRIVVVFLDGQGTALARGITEQVLNRFDPPLLLLVGTAAGREEKTRIGDVIVSTFVVDLTEQRAGDEETSFRPWSFEPREPLTDAKEFLAKRFDARALEAEFAACVEELPVELRAFVERAGNGKRGVHTEYIASGGTMYVGELLQKVWSHDDRFRAVDMESGGFAAAMERRPRSRWLVVRGISDFGTTASKREELRPIASRMAASFLKELILHGLDEAHPRELRRSEAPQPARADPMLYRRLRRYWAPEDMEDAGEVADECGRAIASGNWALAREARRVAAIGGTRTHAPTLRDYLGDGRRLQVALDTPDGLERGIALARTVAASGADFVEVGDPLIKVGGVSAITAVHAAVHDVPVIAEMVSSDWSGQHVDMAAIAGADIVLMLGCRTAASVTEAANEAARLQVPLLIDVPPELCTPTWISLAERVGVQGLAVIGNLDSSSEGMVSLDRVRALRKLTELPIAVSGGLGEDDFPALDEVPWDILVIGRAIVGSSVPGETTRRIARKVHAEGA